MKTYLITYSIVCVSLIIIGVLGGCQTDNSKSYDSVKKSVHTGEYNATSCEVIILKTPSNMTDLHAYVFEYDGCKYIMTYNGGMVHAASCRNPIHKER